MNPSSEPGAKSGAVGALRMPVLALLVGVYLLTRGVSLDTLPIFLDESVHLQWAERLYREGRVIRPVGAGRLLAVAAYGATGLFEDRLLAARVIAMLVGAFTLVLTTLLAGRLFGPLAAILAGILYILSPFALVYDRLALSDGFLTASIAGLMFATHEMSREPQAPLGRALVSLCILLAVVSKVSALMFLFVLPVGAVLLARDKMAGLRSALIAGMCGLLLASPMLWFFWGNRGEIGEQHIVDPMMAGPILRVTLRDMRDWVMAYFTPATLAAAAVSLAVVRNRRALWLAISILLPFCLFALFSQPWSARYVLPTLPPLLMLVAGGMAAIISKQPGLRRGLLAGGLVLIASCQALPFDLALLFNPKAAPFPRDDRTQLVTGWPAGYGLKELARRLEAEAASEPVVALIDTGGLRTVPSGLAILLASRPAVSLIEGDLASPEFQALARTLRKPLFAVTGPRSDTFDFKSQWGGMTPQRLDVYVRPGGEWAATLFRLNTSPTQ